MSGVMVHSGKPSPVHTLERTSGSARPAPAIHSWHQIPSRNSKPESRSPHFSLAYEPKHCALVSGRQRQTELRNTQTEHLSVAGFMKGRHFRALLESKGLGQEEKSTKHGFLGKQSSTQSDLCSRASNSHQNVHFHWKGKAGLGAGDTHNTRQPRGRPAFESSFWPIFFFSLKYDFT